MLKQMKPTSAAGNDSNPVALPPSQNLSPLPPKSYPLFPSVRLLNCFLLTLATTSVNVNYAALNFTLICMVNSTSNNARADKTSVAEQNCPHATNRSSNVGQLEESDSGDLNWSRTERANVQAAYAYMMIFWSIPAGILNHRYGSKRCLVAVLLVSATTSFLFPYVAYLSSWAAFVIRLLSGSAYGMCWPTILYFVTYWAPEANAGTLMTLGASGFPLGTILAFMVSGQFCSLGQHGWQFAFYFGGVLAGTAAVLFAVFYSNDPNENRFISTPELEYIIMTRRATGSRRAQGRSRIPWVKVMTSPPVYAIMSSSFCLGWSFFYVSTSLPSYMNEVMAFDLRSNGFLSALPNIAQFLGRLTFGVVSDRVGRRLKPTVSVKLFDAFALIMPGIMFVIISFQDCTSASVAITCFALGHFFISANTAGYLKSSYYIAPRFVGIISAMCGTAQALPATLVPYVVGFMTEDGTLDQWRQTQYVNVALMAVGAVVFACFGSGAEQTWAKPECPEEDTVDEKGQKFENNGNLHDNCNKSEEPQQLQVTANFINKEANLSGKIKEKPANGHVNGMVRQLTNHSQPPVLITRIGRLNSYGEPY